LFFDTERRCPDERLGVLRPTSYPSWSFGTGGGSFYTPSLENVSEMKQKLMILRQKSASILEPTTTSEIADTYICDDSKTRRET